MNRSKIPYLTHVWNPTTGCSPVSSGCASCWASAYHRRWRKSFVSTVHPEKLDEPLRLRKPSVIGVSFMGDLFHDDVPDDFIRRVFRVMRTSGEHPGHCFVLLTKRPERARVVLTACFMDWPLDNVWLGVSCEDQATADERIPILLDTPAAHRWVSLEPQIGAVDLSAFIGGPYVALPGDAVEPHYNAGLDLVIQGCESGAKRRPFDVAWARNTRAECAAARVPFALKQMPVAGRVMEKPGLDDELCWELPWEVPA